MTCPVHSGSGEGNQHDPRWALICSAVSLYLAKHSGLPVDFQIQRASKANAEYPGLRRHPLGIFLEPKR